MKKSRSFASISLGYMYEYLLSIQRYTSSQIFRQQKKKNENKEWRNVDRLREERIFLN